LNCLLFALRPISSARRDDKPEGPAAGMILGRVAGEKEVPGVIKRYQKSEKVEHTTV